MSGNREGAQHEFPSHIDADEARKSRGCGVPVSAMWKAERKLLTASWQVHKAGAYHRDTVPGTVKAMGKEHPDHD